MGNVLDDLDAFITKTLPEYGVPGAAVAVVQDGKAVMVKGYGVREIGKRAPVDENTIFQLASISKVFTGATVATLVDEGKLGWDDTVSSHVPEFVGYDPYMTRHLTVRDLLAQRTGWPQFIGDILGDMGYDRAEILYRLRFLKPAYSLREVAQYSNPGFFLAGEVAARVGNARWEKLVQDRLLKPLKMSRSGAQSDNLKRDANVSKTHAAIGGKTLVIPPTNQDTMGAAGSVSSTAADMAHWLEMFLNKGSYDGKQILTAETVAEMFKRSMVSEVSFTELAPINEQTGFYYGLGVDSFDYAGHQIIEKAGALAGVRTVMTLLTEKNAGIAVMANLNVTAFPEAVRAFYLNAMLGISPDADVKSIAASNAALAKHFDQTPAKKPKGGKFATPLQKLVGVYENDLYGQFTIVKASDGLAVECGPAKYRGTLTHWQNGVFHLKFPGATNLPDDITFTIGADGTPDSFTDDVLGLFTRVRQ